MDDESASGPGGGLGRSQSKEERQCSWRGGPYLMNQEENHDWGKHSHQKCHGRDFSGGAVVENLPANAGDTGSSPGLGRSHMPQSN